VGSLQVGPTAFPSHVPLATLSPHKWGGTDFPLLEAIIDSPLKSRFPYSFHSDGWKTGEGGHFQGDDMGFFA